jgi:hypothetical protein
MKSTVGVRVLQTLRILQTLRTRPDRSLDRWLSKTWKSFALVMFFLFSLGILTFLLPLCLTLTHIFPILISVLSLLYLPRSLHPFDHLDPLLPLDLFPHAYTHTLIVLPILTAILVSTHMHIHKHTQNTKNIHVSICCCCTLNLDLDPSRVLPTCGCDRVCVCYLRLLLPCLFVCLCAFALIVLYTTTS